jgi:hypothetical protein
LSLTDRDSDDLDDRALTELMHRVGATVSAPGQRPLFEAPADLSALLARLAAVDRELSAPPRARWPGLSLALVALAAAMVATLLLWRRPAPATRLDFDLALRDSLGLRRAAGPVWETSDSGYRIVLDLPVCAFVRVLLYDGEGEVYPLALDAAGRETFAVKGRLEVSYDFAGRNEQDLIVLATASEVAPARLQAVFPERIASFTAAERMPAIAAAIARAQSELAAVTHTAVYGSDRDPLAE